MTKNRARYYSRPFFLPFYFSLGVIELGRDPLISRISLLPGIEKKASFPRNNKMVFYQNFFLFLIIYMKKRSEEDQRAVYD